jgi:nitrate/nitrite-specific signal transduction histidine kinase
MVEKAKCVNEAQNRHLVGSIQHLDLLRMRQSYRLLLATKVHSKQMSEAEAQFEFDRFTSEVVSQADQRDAARAARIGDSILETGRAMNRPRPSSRSVSCTSSPLGHTVQTTCNEW